MTSPQYATRGPGGRAYEIPSPPLPEPFTGPSVTTIQKNGLPSPAIGFWMRNQAIEYAVDNVATWSNLERDAAIDLIKREPDRVRDRAGNTGTDVHAMCERVLRGEDLGDWAKPYEPWLNHFRQFLDDWAVEPLYVERTVVKYGDHGYAGSFDFIARIDGVVTLGDIKTSKSIYPDVGLQLAAYADADVMLSSDGRSCEPMPQVEGLGALHLREDGYAWWPIMESTEELVDAFRAVRAVAEFQIHGRKRVLLKTPATATDRKAYRDELRARVTQVIEWGGASDLAAQWPADIPTLKHDGHTTHQLDAIEYLLRRVEPSWRPQPKPASIDRHAQSIDRLDKLTNQTIFDTIQKYAVGAGIPNLHTATATVEQLDQLDRIIAAVTKVPDAEDRAARIGRATGGRTTSPADITADELAKFLRTRASKKVAA